MILSTMLLFNMLATCVVAYKACIEKGKQRTATNWLDRAANLVEKLPNTGPYHLTTVEVDDTTSTNMVLSTIYTVTNDLGENKRKVGIKFFIVPDLISGFHLTVRPAEELEPHIIDEIYDDFSKALCQRVDLSKF